LTSEIIVRLVVRPAIRATEALEVGAGHVVVIGRTVQWTEFKRRKTLVIHDQVPVLVAGAESVRVAAGRATSPPNSVGGLALPREAQARLVVSALHDDIPIQLARIQ